MPRKTSTTVLKASGRLAGKITIVTGAAQGFGKGIAEELYNEGATIVIADMNQQLEWKIAMAEKTINEELLPLLAQC